jgi:large subunit ribosomal protein L30
MVNKIPMAKLKVTYTKSKIGSTKRQKDTIEALGLKKLNSTVEVEGTHQILGMIEKVRHLVRVEEI